MNSLFHRTFRIICLLLCATPAWTAGAAEDKAAAPAATQEAVPGPGGAMPPPVVVTLTVSTQTVPVIFEYIGLTEASKIVQVRSRVRGFLERRVFVEGSLIKEGDKLYEIDQRPFQADLEIAHARIQQAEAQRKLAERETLRLKSLQSTGAISQSDLDKQVAAFTEAEASVKLAQAEADKAALELSYTRIVAPLTGLVGKSQKDDGSFVDDQNNSLLTEITQVNPIYVSFRVSEREYLDVKRELQAKTLAQTPGQDPFVQIAQLDGVTFNQKGQFNFQDPNVDIQTGTIQFRAEFDNPQNVLKPGQYVKARVRGWQRPNTITVPQRAVSQSPTGTFVYVITVGNQAEFRPIKTGAWVGQDWIVEEGLKGGEQVIVEGLMNVQPGMVVNPQPYKPAAQATPQPVVIEITTVTASTNQQPLTGTPVAGKK
jgi:membrane fusion protein (multidrug efflux system)